MVEFRVGTYLNKSAYCLLLYVLGYNYNNLLAYNYTHVIQYVVNMGLMNRNEQKISICALSVLKILTVGNILGILLCCSSFLIIIFTHGQYKIILFVNYYVIVTENEKIIMPRKKPKYFHKRNSSGHPKHSRATMFCAVDCLLV